MNELTRGLVNNDRLKAVLCKLRAAVELMAISHDPDIATARELVSDSATLVDRLRIDFKKQTGSVALIIILCLPLMVAITSMVIFTGATMVARTQAVNIADSTALGAACALYGADRTPYLILSPASTITTLAEKNGGVYSIEYTIGHWDGAVFTPSVLSNPDTEWWTTWTVEDLMANPLFVNAVRTTAYLMITDTFDGNPITIGGEAIAALFLESDGAGGIKVRKGARLVQ